MQRELYTLKHIAMHRHPRFHDTAYDIDAYRYQNQLVSMHESGSQI